MAAPAGAAATADETCPARETSERRSPGRPPTASDVTEQLLAMPVWLLWSSATLRPRRGTTHGAGRRAQGWQRRSLRKVFGRDGPPVRLEKSLPGHRLSPERSALDALLGEDALDGGPSEVEARVFECAAKPRVVPTTDSRAPSSAAAGPCRLGWMDGRGSDSRRTSQRPARGTTEGWSPASRAMPSRPEASGRGLFPFCASNRRAASVKRRRLGPSRARSTRFSARKYSIASPCRRPIQLATTRMRN
jgi:hypothetical protein